MTRDDIIRMAKESGGELEDGLWLFFERECLRFATMIATYEREACIDVLMRLHERSGESHNYYHFAANQLRGQS